jgi:hypothetical protein
MVVVDIAPHGVFTAQSVDNYHGRGRVIPGSTALLLIPSIAA